MPATPPHELASLIKALAREVGFDLAGIARASSTAYADQYRQWLAAGKHGEMHYLAGALEERLDLTRKFPWARTVVCVGLAYWQDRPPSAPPRLAEGKIARYAWGRDYHKVIAAKLRELERRLRANLPDHPFEARNYCDTGPLLEREFAMRAGLGWVGKHTLLIHPTHGSWFLLGEMVTSLDLAPDSPETDHCGTCRRCIEACPTDAITPYSVDATRCISYLTLENRGAISEEFHPAMRSAGFVVGCDICQDVCPFNRRPLQTSEPDFTPRSPAPAIGLHEIMKMSEQEWDALTRGRASRRAKYDMWQRNAAILAAEPP